VDGGELGRVEKFRFVWKEFFSYKVTLEEHGVPGLAVRKIQNGDAQQSAKFLWLLV